MPYKKRTKADQKNAEGGYKNVVFFTPVADITSFPRPTTTPVNPGDKVKITNAITFGAGNGWVALTCKKHSVTTTAETTGDDGSQSLTWKAIFEILGDDASTLETMQDMLNDDLAFLLKDQDCLNAIDFTLFGDDCLPVDIKISFDGKTTKEGQKVYKLELSVKSKKFFYSGAVTERPSTSSIGNPTLNNVIGSYTGAIGTTITLAVNAAAAVGAPNQTLTYVWKKGGVAITGVTTDYFVKFNAQIADSGSYICEVSDAYGHTVVSTAMVVSIS